MNHQITTNDIAFLDNERDNLEIKKLIISNSNDVFKTVTELLKADETYFKQYDLTSFMLGMILSKTIALADSLKARFPKLRDSDHLINDLNGVFLKVVKERVDAIKRK